MMENKHTYTINQSKTLCHQFYVNYQSNHAIFAKHDGKQKAHTQLTNQKTLCHQFHVNYQSNHMIFAEHHGKQTHIHNYPIEKCFLINFI